MKDKLVKFGKKAPYYKMRNAFILTSVILSVGVALAVPVSIKVAQDYNVNETKGETVPEENSSESLEGGEEKEDLEHYEDNK